MAAFDRAAYLARIGYQGSLRPTAGTAAALSLAHLRTVPFENIEIVPLGRPIRLEPEALFAKIVGRRRGGFCYELNGLFARLLADLGYGVDLLSFRFPEADGYSPEFDHLALRITVPEADALGPAGASWLADVGAGRTSFAHLVPLDPLGAESAPDPVDGAIYRVTAGDGGVYRHVWRREPGGEWTETYRFAPVPRRLSDFAAMCHYHQTSPDSPFTRGSFCSRLTDDGRVTIRDGQLLITRGGEKWSEPLRDAAAVWAAIRDNFGIDVAGQQMHDDAMTTTEEVA